VDLCLYSFVNIYSLLCDTMLMQYMLWLYVCLSVCHKLCSVTMNKRIVI